MGRKRAPGSLKYKLKKTCSCGTKFETNRRNKIHCSDSCRNKKWREENPREMVDSTALAALAAKMSN
jgi:hypothetical protein